ncbi:MAG: MBOAT family protein [Clostridiales bacterium]|nr:MBOAT family protein [Clostridiales bacterium]
MVFSSFTFLLCFLPLSLLCYFLVRGIKARNVVLCLFSLVFYAWGEPIYVFLMMASILLNYSFGLLLGKLETQAKRKAVMAAAVAVNLGAIALFKYGNFILDNLGLLLGKPIMTLSFALPLGISFYTFQILSYVIDVYRRDTPVQKSLLNLATYIVLFPQLVAGPIVRYDQVQNELRERNVSLPDFIEGAKRFAIGLGKKVILANAMASIADPIFDAQIMPSGTAWIAAIAYALQIYFDFSGYSDMAIGMGRFFGFHFAENFNYPYIAESITDFWRRWHMSLSTWFRDYVYFPLGGSRCKLGRNIFNLMVVWALTGLWHGASWNFVLWGLYYGILLIMEKYVLKNLLSKLPGFLRHILTLLLVLLGWVIFRLESVTAILAFAKALFVAPFYGLAQYLSGHAGVLENTAWMLPAILGCLPLSKWIKKRMENKRSYPWLSGAFAVVVYYFSIALLMGSTYNPFIYFRF